MTEETLQEQVESWLQAQMPVISMHGGTSAVREADPETGEVVIELGGACSGCGIGPRTEEQILVNLVKDVPAATDVTVKFLGDGSEDWDYSQAESFMGIDRREGGRGGSIETGGSDHF
ncbi:NifU family protein [Halobacteriaceae archaeon GCM10025711]